MTTLLTFMLKITGIETATTSKSEADRKIDDNKEGIDNRKVCNQTRLNRFGKKSGEKNFFTFKAKLTLL